MTCKALRACRAAQFPAASCIEAGKDVENITELIRTILAAISDVMVAGCLLVVIMLIFSFLGMESLVAIGT